MSDKLQANDDQIRRFVRELMTASPVVVGDCLGEDDSVAYALDLTSVRRTGEIDRHLATCADCATRLSAICEEASEYLAPANAGRLDSLRRRLQQAWSQTVARPTASAPQSRRVASWVRQVVNAFAPPVMVDTRLLQTLGTPPPLTWTTPGGITCRVDDHREPAVLTLQASSAEWSGQLLALSVEAEGQTVPGIEAWLVLHPEGSGYAGCLRLPPGFQRPPARATLSVSVCQLDPAMAPDVDTLRGAYGSLDRDEDRAAWRAWIDAETAAGRLADDTRAALLRDA